MVQSFYILLTTANYVDLIRFAANVSRIVLPGWRQPDPSGVMIRGQDSDMIGGSNSISWSQHGCQHKLIEWWSCDDKSGVKLYE